MRKTAFLILMLTTGILVSGASHAATITLQQGLNGYSGCQDSFVTTGAYSEDSAGVNYGINPFLIINSEHFESF